MTDPSREPPHASAEALRRALLHAGLAAYDDAGLSGLCAEGRWEAAVDAMRGLDLSAIGALPVHFTVSLSHVVAAVGSASAPPPSGGSVAAAVGALAAALTQMVAGLTAGRPKYADVEVEMQHAARHAAALAEQLVSLVRRDSDAVVTVAAAYRLPKTPEDAASHRAETIARALHSATEAPLEIARAAATVAELAATVAERGNRNAIADAAVAAFLAEAVCRAAALTVRVNVPALRDAAAGRRLDEEAVAFGKAAATAAARAAAVASR